MLRTPYVNLQSKVIRGASDLHERGCEMVGQGMESMIGRNIYFPLAATPLI